MRIGSSALALISLALAGCAAAPQAQTTAEVEAGPATALDERIAYYAKTYEVPEALIRRSIKRESGYNPKARNGPYWGLMQIRVDTARGLGYRGSGSGLLDADTNLKYAARYLANAYIVAGGDNDRAMRLYAGGYYYAARRKGVLDQMAMADRDAASTAVDTTPTASIAEKQ